MIDRTAREKVIEAIDRFLNDQTDNFEFDEQIWNIDSEDDTVAYAVQVLWFHYDDCTIHKAVLNKTEWDFIQRIKLLLMSDAEVSETSESRWSWDHALACVAFAAFVILALVVGWGWCVGEGLAIGQSAGAQAAALCSQGEVVHLSIHGRRAQPDGHVRSQARAS